MAKIVQTAGRNALGTFAPEFAHYNDDVLFGENWNNEDIDVKLRSILTVTALMAQGITDNSLKFHLQNAKDHGVTQKEIAAIITHVGFYAGWPKAWAVFNLAKEVWNVDAAGTFERKSRNYGDSEKCCLHFFRLSQLKRRLIFIFVYNSIKQLTTVSCCYILFA